MLPRCEPLGAPLARAPVLFIGDSLAVLIRAPAATPAARDEQAANALRAATGDQRILIARRPSGRPRLAPPLPELGISLSRRGDLLLAGFSPRSGVGVDLEVADPAVDPHRLARDHFARAEAAAIAQTPTHEASRDLFFRLWVAKEAALKATGRGIYDGADEPCLHAYLPALARDRSIIRVPSSPRVPSLHITLTRTSQFSAIYCALAVVEA